MSMAAPDVSWMGVRPEFCRAGPNRRRLSGGDGGTGRQFIRNAAPVNLPGSAIFLVVLALFGEMSATWIHLRSNGTRNQTSPSGEGWFQDFNLDFVSLIRTASSTRHGPPGPFPRGCR
jgi:hypothetical protein